MNREVSESTPNLIKSASFVYVDIVVGFNGRLDAPGLSDKILNFVFNVAENFCAILLLLEFRNSLNVYNPRENHTYQTS